MSWALYNTSTSSTSDGAATYDLDRMLTEVDQGYPYNNAHHSSPFMLDPTISIARSPQPDLFQVLPPPVVDSSSPGAPNLEPQESVRVPDNPNNLKRLRISNITEENILPENQRRKRSKPDKLSL